MQRLYIGSMFADRKENGVEIRDVVLEGNTTVANPAGSVSVQNVTVRNGGLALTGRNVSASGVQTDGDIVMTSVGDNVDPALVEAANNFFRP